MKNEVFSTAENLRSIFAFPSEFEAAPLLCCNETWGVLSILPICTSRLAVAPRRLSSDGWDFYKVLSPDFTLLFLKSVPILPHWVLWFWTKAALSTFEVSHPPSFALMIDLQIQPAWSHLFGTCMTQPQIYFIMQHCAGERQPLTSAALAHWD